MALIHNIVGPPTAARVLLLVHGYGADERDLGGVAAVPRSRGPLPRRVAARARWPRRRGSRGSTSTACSPATSPTRRSPPSLDELDDLLDAVCTEHGLASQRGGGRRVLAGRCAGARARHCGAQRARAPGRRPRVQRVPPRRRRRRRSTGRSARSIPVLVQHGTDDPLIPVDAGGRCARARSDRARRSHHVLRVPDGPLGRGRGLEEAHAWLTP